MPENLMMPRLLLVHLDRRLFLQEIGRLLLFMDVFPPAPANAFLVAFSLFFKNVLKLDFR